MQRLGIGQAIILAVLVALLIGTGIGVISTWNATSDVEISEQGWIALGLGTFFSLIIGCGLMALVFYSSRHGYDEAVDEFRDASRRERAKRMAGQNKGPGVRRGPET
jgi:TRAP-type C4-dicarboxylate transport system permease small subunit